MREQRFAQQPSTRPLLGSKSKFPSAVFLSVTHDTTDDPHSNGDLPFTSELNALAKFTVHLASLWPTVEAARAQCTPTNGLVCWWRSEGNAADTLRDSVPRAGD